MHILWGVPETDGRVGYEQDYTGVVVAEREGEGERICHAQIGAVSKWPH